MKTEIRATVHAAVELDETERFVVTGRDDYGSVDYTIQVERVRDFEKAWTQQRGVIMSGTRVLKSGAVSYTNKRVVMLDGDERIPAAIAEAVAEMRERVAHLNAYIAEES